MRFNILDKPGSIFFHIEEIRFLAGTCNRRAAVGAFTVNDLSFGIKGFARLAVPTLIFSLVYVALTQKTLKYLLHGADVSRLRRADKPVIADVHKIPHTAYLSGYTVHIRLRLDPGFFGVILDLLTVFVRSGA